MAQRELLSLSLYSLLASNRNGVFIVYFPLFLVEEKGATLPLALAVLTVAWLPGTLLGPWLGRLSDRARRRRPFLLLGEALAFPLFLAVVFVPGYLLSSLLFVLAELALAIGAPAYTAYVADVTRTHERGEGYGLLNATASVGGVVGFFAVALLTIWFGLSALFPFVAAVMVGTLGVVVFLVPDIHLDHPLPARPPLRELKPLIAFSFAVSIRAIGAGAVGTFYGYLAASLGATPFEVGMVAVAGMLTGAVVSVPFGRLVDRFGEIRGIWYGTVLTLASYGIFVASSTWPETVPGSSVRFGGQSFLGTGMNAYVARIAPPGQRAEYLGIFSLINSSLWSIGPLVGAVAIAFSGYLGLFAMAIGTSVVSLVAMEAIPGAREVPRRAPLGSSG